jgi:dTDP-4-dehydrorhamnose 3,5-epimerase
VDVAVDIRRGSPTYGKAVSALLSRDNWRQLWLPAGFAHGFCTLEPDTDVLYKVTSFYAPEQDKGIMWSDPDIAIDWPDIANPDLLSDKDRKLPPLAGLPPYFSI